jgi:hypothetical protein
MALIPGMAVTAPEPLRPRRYGLFDAASGPLDLPAHGEGGGVRFVPVTCGGGYAIGSNCYEPGEAPAKPLDGETAEVETGVFLALATLNCGAVGYTRPEYETKVRRRLEGVEQAIVEAAFWTGLDLAGQPLGILNLDEEAEDVDPGYDASSIIEVVAALERYAYTERKYGGVAYIHAPIEAAAFAGNAGLVVPEGSSPTARRYTPGGSVWSFGAYPGGSIMISGQTTVWRAAEVSVATAFENASNELVLVAERAYSVAFECFAAEAEFNPIGVS